MYYSFEVIENWPGKTHYFISIDENVCGLRINENENRSKSQLIEWSRKELEERGIRIHI